MKKKGKSFSSKKKGKVNGQVTVRAVGPKKKGKMRKKDKKKEKRK